MLKLHKEKTENVEDEIQKLRQELAVKEKKLAEHKELQEPVSTKLKKPEEEKIKEAEKVIEEIKTPKKPSKKAPPSPIMTDESLVEDLQKIMAMKKPQQIKVLVYLAFKKGVRYTFNIAKQLKDPYLLDSFHDTLVDELYNLLIKKHKI